jgi:molybdate transport system regulatory protein
LVMTDSKLHISVVLGNGAVLGPRKIALLEAIEANGSITAAAHSLDLSYRYAWQQIRSINDMFVETAVVTVVGGTKRGGAKLSGVGKRVVMTYRAAQRRARAATLEEVHALNSIGRNRKLRQVTVPASARACWDSGFSSGLGCDSSFGWTDSF